MNMLCVFVCVLALLGSLFAEETARTGERDKRQYHDSEELLLVSAGIIDIGNSHVGSADKKIGATATQQNELRQFIRPYSNGYPFAHPGYSYGYSSYYRPSYSYGYPSYYHPGYLYAPF